MNFNEWRGSEENTARNYRWYITSCGISSRDDAEEAAKNAFEAGKKEGIKKATRLLSKIIIPDKESL
jgi:hypothetical protein